MLVIFCIWSKKIRDYSIFLLSYCIGWYESPGLLHVHHCASRHLRNLQLNIKSLNKFLKKLKNEILFCFSNDFFPWMVWTLTRFWIVKKWKTFTTLLILHWNFSWICCIWFSYLKECVYNILAFFSNTWTTYIFYYCGD